MDFRVLASQKSSFSTVFIRFSDMAQRHVRFIYKPNAFLIILEALLWFWLGNHQFETGFIRVLHKQKWPWGNLVFRWFYKVFRRSENALRKPSLGIGAIGSPGILQSSYTHFWQRLSPRMSPDPYKHNGFLAFRWYSELPSSPAISGLARPRFWEFNYPKSPVVFSFSSD